MGVCAPPPRSAKMWVQQGTVRKTTAIANIVTCGSACTSGLSLRTMSFCPPLPLPSYCKRERRSHDVGSQVLQHERAGGEQRRERDALLECNVGLDNSSSGDSSL